MSYKIIEHTADYHISARGKTLAEVFNATLRGMSDFLKVKEVDAHPDASREISLLADTPVLLLIDFLSEALRLSLTNKEIYHQIDFKEIEETKLKGNLIGSKVEGFDNEIKAVTYHRAKLEKKTNGLWEAEVIFDI